ncbi:hypothetical protein DFH09DRAFT_1082493 [Mycena vulgaris]|nr:hypothetical protein DFH09DRAFT_1082493 [Mycena vulgaris]
MTRITTKVEMEFNEGWTTPDVKGPVKKRPERGRGRAGDGDKVREFRKVLVDNSRVMKGVMVMRNGDPKSTGGHESREVVNEEDGKKSGKEDQTEPDETGVSRNNLGRHGSRDVKEWK